MKGSDDPANLNYYFSKRIRPKHTEIFLHKKPEYLENYLADRDNFCSIHGFHKDWQYRRDNKFKKHTYSSMRCRKCANLGARYWHFKHPIKAMTKDAKKHAKDNLISFNLNSIDIYSKLKMQKNRCAYSGRKFDVLRCRPSLDQKVARLGYTTENIQILEKHVNIMKSNFDEDYFFELVKYVFDFRIKSSSKFGTKNLLYEIGVDVKDAKYSKDLIERFNAGQSVSCKKHGDHRDWRVSHNKTRGKSNLVCLICKREVLRHSRLKKKMGENSYSEQLSQKIKQFKLTGLSTCEKHGSHKEFKLRTKGRRLDCKLCVQETRDHYYSTYPLKAIFLARKSAIKTQKKYHNREFSITYDELEKVYEKQNGRCWYSNIVLEKNVMGGISMDRIDNDIGYTKDNVCLAFSDINQMKSSLDLSDFMSLISDIYQFKQADLPNH